MVHGIVRRVTLHCALWYIGLCFVVHCIVFCGKFYCALWYISLCFMVIHVRCGRLYNIALCGKPALHCAMWCIALCVVVHCIALCGPIVICLF